MPSGQQASGAPFQLVAELQAPVRVVLSRLRRTAKSLLAVLPSRPKSSQMLSCCCRGQFQPACDATEIDLGWLQALSSPLSQQPRLEREARRRLQAVKGTRSWTARMTWPHVGPLTAWLL
mmetsp:Transcript_116151/g.375308  ORF Transcript_116151/g.375308 Transcript_116151/m.375308 type:complete len:120 (+) Transcript_116151:400-759(+)